MGRLIFNARSPRIWASWIAPTPPNAFKLEITDKVGKKLLGKIIDRCNPQARFTIATEMLDDIKALGYKYSTRGAITVSIMDMSVPEKKYQLIAEAEKEVVKIDRQYSAALSPTTSATA